MNPKIFAAIAVLVIVGLAGWWIFTGGNSFGQNPEGLDTQVAETPQTVATYACADDKSIEAGFGNQQVTLTLSDGRQFTLEQTVSASGARYANDGDQIVFWEKGVTAFIEENGEMAYVECVKEGSDQPIEID